MKLWLPYVTKIRNELSPNLIPRNSQIAIGSLTTTPQDANREIGKSVAFSEAKNIYTSLKLTASLHLKIKRLGVDKKAFC